LAQGELVTNVDSDNVMHSGFLERLNQCASVGPTGLLIVPETFLLPKSNRFLLKGRFAMYKEDIEFLRGFDEDLDDGFSHDDVNFVLRAMLARFRIVRFEKAFIKGRILTTDEERRKCVRSHQSFYEMKLKNAKLTEEKLARVQIQVNNDGWGEATVREVSASTERCFQI